MNKYFINLRACPLFDRIEDENLTAMLVCLDAHIKAYKKNEIIIAEGDPARNIGIVLSGKAQIERTDYYGNRTIMTGLEAPDLFGESFACSGIKEMPVDVVAAEDAEIMLIDCKKIIHSCSGSCEFHNQIIFNLLKIVATKNIILNRKAEITSKRTTREKLMTYLLQQAKAKGKSYFTIPFDRRELADFLGVDRSGLSAEISKLRAEGVIESEKSKFRLLQ